MKTLLLAAALAASPPQQFDLLCAGTLSVISLDGETTEPYTYQVRLDLSEGKWCEGECKKVRDIGDVAATQITLSSTDEGSGRDRRKSSNFVNRETGQHRMFSSSDGLTGPMTMSWEGTCEPKPFSGFPDFKTRF